MENDPQINNSFYDSYGERWYTSYDDPIALLRAEHRVKLDWIVSHLKDHLPGSGTIVDVGCGGGFLSNGLALAGHQVTGVDLSSASLEVARNHDQTMSVKYEVADAFKLPYPDGSFDALTAMDFLEHIENPQEVIKEFSRVLRPHGLFFFHTFNRNILSWLVVIKLLEWFVKNTPKNMHVLRLFIRPDELKKYCLDSGMEVVAMTGIRPVLSSIDWEMIRTGIVSKEMEFKLTRGTLLSYLGMAIKKGAPSGPLWH